MAEPGADSDEVEPRLYLIGPAEPLSGDLFSDQLADVLEQVLPAAFLLPAGLATNRPAAEALRKLCAERGTAFFVRDDPDLAIALAADGLHQSDPGLVGSTRDAMSKDQILGADAGRSRHDAMAAGESGADYVAFGQPDQPVGQEIIDLVSWWRDLFVLPCLAYANTVDDAKKLADAGADFIGISTAIWDNPEGPAERARRLQATIDKNRDL